MRNGWIPIAPITEALNTPKGAIVRCQEVDPESGLYCVMAMESVDGWWVTPDGKWTNARPILDELGRGGNP